MAFFKRNVSGAAPKRKARGGGRKQAQPAKRPKKSIHLDDQEIPSSEDDERGNGDAEDEVLSDEEQNRLATGDHEEVFEDVRTKTSREAKRILDQLQAEDKPVKSEEELSDEDLDAIAHRLKKDIDEQIAREQRYIADNVVVDEDSLVSYRPHRFSPVCVAISNDGRFVLSCSKDGSIVKYDIEQGKKVATFDRSKKDYQHKGHLNCVAISGDDKFIATGGDDKIVRIWNFEDFSHVKNFAGHRGPITSLVFRRGSTDLYSASTDKCIRAWNLEQMGFVEILYGHSDPIAQLDMLYKPRLLSAGTTARTVHLFKIEKSSQLVFNGLNDCISVDTVSMINDDHYVSGQMDGSLYIWSIFKKKPVCVVKAAHGTQPENKEPRWIVTVAALPFTDLLVSGSSDGKLKLWKIANNYKSLALIDEFPLAGFVNDIRFAPDGKTLVCAVGQEHRSGRWWKCQEARNSIVILRLEYDDERNEDEEPTIVQLKEEKPVPAKQQKEDALDGDGPSDTLDNDSNDREEATPPDSTQSDESEVDEQE